MQHPGRWVLAVVIGLVTTQAVTQCTTVNSDRKQLMECVKGGTDGQKCLEDISAYREKTNVDGEDPIMYAFYVGLFTLLTRRALALITEED